MEIEHAIQGEWQVQSLREADAVSILNTVSRRKEACTILWGLRAKGRES